jgi:hypothetical protein
MQASGYRSEASRWGSIQGFELLEILLVCVLHADTGERGCAIHALRNGEHTQTFESYKHISGLRRRTDDWSKYA